MKAWLKGGLIGIGVLILLSILYLITDKGQFGNIWLLIIAILTAPLLIFNLFNLHIFYDCHYGGTCPDAILGYIIFTIYFLLIGAFIGWLIGKKKQSS